MQRYREMNTWGILVQGSGMIEQLRGSGLDLQKGIEKGEISMRKE